MCSDIKNKEEINGKIAIVERGECTFVDKARRAMNAGASAVIIIDNVPDTSINSQPPFAMSGDGKDDVKIPTCFLFTVEANSLKEALNLKSDLEVSNNFTLIIKLLIKNKFQLTVASMTNVKEQSTATTTSETSSNKDAKPEN